MAASAVPGRLSEAGSSTLTPVKRPTFVDTPGRSRPSGASPAYSSRKHSLYGIEDRVVLDLGSRLWKVGFSGETEPRAVFWAQDSRDGEESEIWDLDVASLRGCRGDRREGKRLIGVRVIKKLRDVFHKHLISDPKLRKVIVIENTFLPTIVKEKIAQALFENLKTPSVGFTSSSLLAFAACGRITGLVIDCGWLETTITPVYYSRPLYHLARAIPLAGRALHCRLRALLHHHATYYPPAASISSLARQPTKPPRSVLTDQVIERIITEACFVGDVITDPPQVESIARPSDPPSDEMDDVLLMDTLRSRLESTSTATDLRVPIPSEGRGLGSGMLAIPGWVRERASELIFEDAEVEEADGLPSAILQTLLKLPVDLRPLLISTMLVVGGTASLPGFIPRLRMSLLQLLPARLATNTVADSMDLDPPIGEPADPSGPIGSPSSAPTRRDENIRWRKRGHEPYRILYPLASKLAILNDPTPLIGDGAVQNAGVAPKWTPGLMSWVGGSLAGVLKTSGPAMLLEDYETQLSMSNSRGQAYRQELEESEAELAATIGLEMDQLQPGEAMERVKRENEYLGRKRGWRNSVVSDWTRSVKA